MDIATLIGLVAALVGLLGGMIFKGVSLSALGNLAAIFIIIIGTIGAVLIAFPMSDIKNLPSLFGRVFSDKKGAVDHQATIKTLVEYAQIVRKDGALSLESRIAGTQSPFLKRGLTLLMMGMKPEEIEEVLATDLGAQERRHSANAHIFTQAGTYAPTLGVLGAVIGLIAALANMGDQVALGHAISAAFMATVYGIFTGYVLWHPFANKLKRKSKEEALNNTIIIEGILSLAAGDSPVLTQEKMVSLLSTKEKEKFLNNTGGGEV